MSKIGTRLAEIRRQLAIDEGQHLVGLEKAETAAWARRDTHLAEKLGQMKDALRGVIAEERAEIVRLLAAAGGAFKLTDAKSVKILNGGSQAVVILSGLDGALVERHVHLRGGRDRYGNDYRSLLAAAVATAATATTATTTTAA
jgi:hypothetical protein